MYIDSQRHERIGASSPSLRKTPIAIAVAPHLLCEGDTCSISEHRAIEGYLAATGDPLVPSAKCVSLNSLVE